MKILLRHVLAQVGRLPIQLLLVVAVEQALVHLVEPGLQSTHLRRHQTLMLRWSVRCRVYLALQGNLTFAVVNNQLRLLPGSRKIVVDRCRQEERFGGIGVIVLKVQRGRYVVKLERFLLGRSRRVLLQRRIGRLSSHAQVTQAARLAALLQVVLEANTHLR